MMIIPITVIIGDVPEYESKSLPWSEGAAIVTMH